MPIITLSRELGSRGDDVALDVAKRLGLRLVGRDLINQAARQAGLPEVALAEIDELGLLGVKPTRKAMAQYRETAEHVIRELADEGNVLMIGRGSQVVLARHPGVLHVRVIAPKESRVLCVQERCRISAEAAAARIEASDRVRAGYIHRHYGIRWDAPELYDLIVQVSQLTVADAGDLVCLAVERLARVVGEVRV